LARRFSLYLESMADSVPVPSLARAREQKIDELSAHFANDDLSLEDLERRIERVYKASNVVELDEITADLRRAVAPAALAPLGKRGSSTVAPSYQVESGRLLALMSSTRRVGRWAVPYRLDVVAVMSDTKIDFTQAVMPGGIVEVHLRVMMASCRLVVPPNMRVINEMHSVMSNVRSRADEPLPGTPATLDTPVIRLTGLALMSEVKIVVRRREDPMNDDDDDD
jgi:hypothetical protein